MTMEVQHIKESETITIRIKGECDASSSIVLDDAMILAIQEKPNNLFIDCTDLSYISSPGIGVFTSKIDVCEQEDIKLVFFGINESVMTVFDILGLNQLITIVESKHEAITLLAR